MEASRLGAGMEATVKDWAARPDEPDVERGSLARWFVKRLAELLGLEVPDPSAPPPAPPPVRSDPPPRVGPPPRPAPRPPTGSEEHTSELQSQPNLVCRLLLEKKRKTQAAVAVGHNLLRLGYQPLMNWQQPQ